jgi:hypothetical protein
MRRSGGASFVRTSTLQVEVVLVISDLACTGRVSRSRKIEQESQAGRTQKLPLFKQLFCSQESEKAHPNPVSQRSQTQCRNVLKKWIENIGSFRTMKSTSCAREFGSKQDNQSRYLSSSGLPAFGVPLKLRIQK